MKYQLSLYTTRPRSLLLAGTAAVLMAFGAATIVDTPAWAAQGETSKGAMLRKQGGGKGGGAGQMHQGAGSTIEQRILRGGTSLGEPDEDSDRPEWAGQGGDKTQTPGGGNKGSDSKKGGLYGDLYIVLRDASGVPILNADGYVQPIAFTVDADGNMVPVLDENGDYVLMPLDAEGEVDISKIPEGANWVTAEVEFSRLSIARSPERVLDQALDEAYLALTNADSVTLDPSGRIVVTIDGEEQTFDSPLVNLALYEQLVTYGNLILRDDEGNPILVDGNVVPLLPTSILPDSAEALSQADLDLAASLFAASADKSGVLNVDVIVYMNSILGIDGTLAGDYVDYSSFSYDRAAAYDGVTAEVLVEQPDGTYVVKEVSILDAVFGGEDGSFDPTVDNVTATNADGFTAAADDALQVIEFIHNYAPPEA